LCHFSANFTSKHLHGMPTQNVSQSNCRKAGAITLIGPGSTVILLIGPLIEIASMILSKADGMLQGI